jgi:hypothetical protein
MQTQDQWAKTLKQLRDANETALFAAVSNLHVSFTNDAIILTPHNQTTFELLENSKHLLPACVQIKHHKKSTSPTNLEQKLFSLFGDKLVIQ